jgi:hypothetical protein
MKNILLILGLLSTSLWASPQGVPVNTTTVVGTDSIEALAANKNRGYLIMQNNGSGNCWVKFGSAQTGLEGLVLGASQNYEPVESFSKSSVYMRCAASGSSIVFLETNY